MEFCVLGRIAVVVDGRELVLGSTREAALLADLLVHAGQVVPASRLIDDLWRGHPPPGATATLQTYVKNLRRVLEPRRAQGAPSAVLVSRRPGYLLNLEPDALDAWRCEGLVTGGRAALASGNAAVAAEQLRTALGLWRGPAYGELADESYLQSEAARLEELRLVAIEDRVQADLARGHHADLCGELELLVAEHPYRERLWGHWMLALYRADRQADALRAFQRIRRLLGDELGIEPGGALSNLERAILLHEPELDWSSTPSNGRPGRSMAADVLNPPAAVPPPARLTRAVEGPFVGRGQELAVMLETLDAADTERRRRVVLLSGEPGIGKTALAGAFARVAHERGSSVSYGRCDEDLGLPYQPWATAVAHLMDHCPPGVLDEVVTTYSPDLARLGPALSHLAPDSSPSGDPEIARHQLFSAVARVLEAAGRPARLVVVLDDLHWGDVPSLQLLRYLVGSELPVALLVVGTYRTSDVARGGPFDDLLAWLQLEAGVTRVELRGLDTAELSALLELSTGLSADRDTAALRDALERETDGNPFFVGELLRHLIETGVIACDSEGHWSVCGTMDEQGLPMNARTVIVHRVARLGDEAVRVLSLAAVMGRDFDLATLAAASGRSEDDVLDVLDTAIAAALVVNTAGDDFSFAHALVGHALSDALAPARRVRAHRRIATAIEGISGPTPAARIPELAFHFAEACGSSPGGKDLQRAISYAHAAGDAALQNLAPDQALRWFRQALALLERVPDAEPSLRCTLMVDVGDAQRQAGDPGFRETLLAAGRCAQELGETETLIAAALATSRGVFSTTGLVDDEPFALIEAAAEAAGTSDTKHRARLLSLLALERMTSANYLARRKLVDEAVAICRRLDDPATLLDVLVRSFDAIRAPDSLADRLSTTAEAEQLALSLHDRVGRFWTVFQRTFAAIESGDVTEAQRCRRETVALASQLGQPTMRWLATMNETWFALLGGDADQAETLASEALQLGSASGQPDATVLYTFQLHIIRWHQGRGADVIDVLEELADSVPLPLFRAAKARVYFDIGRHAEARDLLAVEADAAFAHLVDLSWLAVLSNWAEVAAGLGDRATVDLLHKQLLPWSTQVICTRTHVAGAVAHYLGMLDAARHDYVSAEMHFDRALTVHRSLRAPFHVARTHLEWARMLLRQALPGGTGTARLHLESAQRLADGAGCALVYATSEGILREVASTGRDA